MQLINDAYAWIGIGSGLWQCPPRYISLAFQPCMLSADYCILEFACFKSPLLIISMHAELPWWSDTMGTMQMNPTVLSLDLTRITQQLLPRAGDVLNPVSYWILGHTLHSCSCPIIHHFGRMILVQNSIAFHWEGRWSLYVYMHVPTRLWVRYNTHSVSQYGK